MNSSNLDSSGNPTTQIELARVFLEVHLQHDLEFAKKQQIRYRDLIKDLEKLQEELETYETLKRPTTIRLDVCDAIIINATIENANNVLIDVGLGNWTEMKVSEALQYCLQLSDFYKKRATRLIEKILEIENHKIQLDHHMKELIAVSVTDNQHLTAL